MQNHRQDCLIFLSPFVFDGISGSPLLPIPLALLHTGSTNVPPWREQSICR
jgi:hypothetical protein